MYDKRSAINIDNFRYMAICYVRGPSPNELDEEKCALNYMLLSFIDVCG